MTAGLHPKITASVLAGAVTGMLVAEGERRGISIGASEAADLTVIVGFIAGFFMPNGDNGNGNPLSDNPAVPVVVPPPAPAIPPPPAPVVVAPPVVAPIVAAAPPPPPAPGNPV